MNSLQAFRKNPLTFLKVRLNDWWYTAKCWIFPHNVVKCSHLPKTWCDRDNLMFHAAFQILVDFVELEQPFTDWDWKYRSKRFDSVVLMRDWIEANYATDEGRAGFYADFYGEEDKKKQDLATAKTYKTYTEILDLYEWYRDKKYELDSWELQQKTGEDIVLDENGISYVPNGKTKELNWQQVYEEEQRHRDECDKAFERLIAIRHYLWT